jgi:Rod binding domain-containing protein
MAMDPIIPDPTLYLAAPSAQDSPKKIEGAAQQFEALLIGQMLKSVHESDDDSDNSSETMLDVANQQFSQLLANNGGLGLAQMIVKGLKQGAHNANR